MKITTGHIASLLKADLEGDSEIAIVGPCKIEEGQSGYITFLANMKYEHYLYDTKASAALVSKSFSPQTKVSITLIKVDDVYQAIATLLAQFGADVEQELVIDLLSRVSPTAEISKNVGIGAFSIVADGAKIGSNTLISDQVYIGKQVEIGMHCKIYPGVKIYKGCKIGNNVVIHSNAVIGSDGFGFTPDGQGVYHKIEQIGIVHIEDDVEIGSCTVIDRATMGETRVKKGAKIDNLVQLAHNVVIGENTVIAAQTGIAGSTEVSKNCIIGGQVGLAGHIKIAEGTMIQAKSGLSSDVKEKNKRWYGYPALDYVAYLRSYSYFKKLPEIVDKIRELELKIIKFGNESQTND